MNVIADIAIVPIGVGISLSHYVAACERILTDSGLNTQLHANGTNVEGDWEDVFQALRKCHEQLHKMGAPRVSSNLRIGTRIDRNQSMEDKITSVKHHLSSETHEE